MSRQSLELAIRNRDYVGALALGEALFRAERPDPDIGAMHGHVLQQLGRHADARRVLDLIKSARPQLASVWIDLCNACIALEDWDAAARSLRHFQTLLPQSAAGWFAGAQIAFAGGRHGDAEAAFARAAAAHPSWVERRFRLGNSAFDQQRFADAAVHYQACVRLRPDWLEARLNLVSSLSLAERYADALVQVRLAGERFPDEVRLLVRYSQLLDLVASPEAERLAVRQRWIEAEPESAQAQLAYANALSAVGENERAHMHYQRAIALDPGQLQARWTALHLPRTSVFSDDEEMQAFARQWRADLAFFESLPEPPDSASCRRLINSCANFSLAYLGSDLRSDYERYGAVLKKLCDRVLPAPPPARPGPDSARVRVGVMSAHFHWHSVSRVWRDLLLGLDAGRIELVCFHLGQHDDASVAAWRARADLFIEGSRDVLGWHQALIDTPLDVLVFLDLGMHPVSQALATQRYARVQCTTSAHPVTSGLAAVDYYLSSAVAEAEDADRHYSESLWRLPGLAWAYTPTDASPSAPASVRPPSLPGSNAGSDDGGPIRFYCAQNGVKLLPQHDAIFARILAGVPDSLLSLTPRLNSNGSARLRARMQPSLQQHGLDPDRCLHIHPEFDYAGYLGVLAQADVMLDTMLFSGGLTSMDALSRDLPIVTLPGQLLRSRQTMAMLKILQLDELIATDVDDYVRIAVRLAREPHWRADLRGRIAERKHRLFEYAATVSALQDFLLDGAPSDRRPSVL
jgi:protein O-GlcNAc transferase